MFKNKSINNKINDNLISYYQYNYLSYPGILSFVLFKITILMIRL